MRFVLEEIEPDESRKHACDRLAPKLSVKAVTLYNWVKQQAPAGRRPTPSPGSIEELRAQNAALRKENRELARANALAAVKETLHRLRDSNLGSVTRSSRNVAELSCTRSGLPGGTSDWRRSGWSWRRASGVWRPESWAAPGAVSMSTR